MSHEHSHNHQHCHHCHGDGEQHRHWTARYKNEILSLLALVAGMLLQRTGLFDGVAGGWLAPVYFILALLPVAKPILAEAWEAWRGGDLMNEFTLMLLACVGAFVIGEYPEGVAILLFYSFGEKLEDSASQQARGRISSLLERIPSQVEVVNSDGTVAKVEPKDVKPGDMMRVKPGERVAVDAALVSPGYAEFDCSAITGESVPQGVAAGGEVASGAISLDREVTMKCVRAYGNSTMTKIIAMIEDAASRKSHSETLLRKITRYYTPAVMIAAVLLILVPWIVAMVGGEVFEWRVWLYRSLVLMVCSCPCALVVSIPLSYFAAIGNALRRGLLFKGSRYLDAMRGIDTLYLDKTGTLTTGQFSIAAVVPAQGVGKDELLGYAAALDAQSTHPLAVAIKQAAPHHPEAEDVRTVAHGMEGVVNGHNLLVGSAELMRAHGVEVPPADMAGSVVCVAVDGKYAGAVYLEDRLKPDAASTVAGLHKLGVKRIVVLSGDREKAVAKAAQMVGADGYEAGLLPQTKHGIVERSRNQGRKVAFVGDGINDAPSLASADVGIAIGTGGTDVAMESADAVITGNGLNLLNYAIRLSRKIKRVVAENVTFAIAVKLAVMVLGTMGVASLWAAVFADTGITVLTVLWTMIALRR